MPLSQTQERAPLCLQAPLLAGRHEQPEVARARHIGSAGTQAIVGSAGIAGPPICWTQACPAGHAQASVPSGTHLHSIASQ